MLWEENARSVNARYEPTLAAELVGNVVPLPRRWLPSYARLTPVEVLKACACYDYQACETDDYRDTVAFALVELIRGHAISLLPGYDDAAWEVCR